ncbi:MAG: acetolactate synthase small subunit [Deltaproteobacteria bacterium]|nr:MAG: acetolactate synthase small subunit [Deltaproteobacteria bacterium]
MKHTLSVLVENEFGVLARVASLFSARGFNIESLCVAETLDPSLSLMTIVTMGDEMIMEQITKQLNKLINVIKVTDLSAKKFVDRELVLIKMKATKTNRAEILRISDIFRGKVVDVSHKTLTIEVTGDEGKIAAMIELLKPLGIKEVARTGKIAMLRGAQ